MNRLQELHDLGFRFKLDNGEVSPFACGVKKIGQNWTWFRAGNLEDVLEATYLWATTSKDSCSECGREK